MIYSFIPARAGSTRLKDKNFLMLENKRLFEWSIDIANKSKEVDKIIFSTDSDKYINYANSIQLSKELIIDKRSKKNSSKNIKIYDYLKNDFLKENKYLNDGDYILMLLPTQPFRKVEDISKVVELNKKTNKNIFSSRQYNFHVSFAFELLGENQYKPLFPDSPLLTGNTRSQDQVNYLHPDGSIYFLSVKSLKEKNLKSIYSEAVPFKSTSKYHIDIDDEQDFEFARGLAKLL